MELYLDTANVAEVERLARIYPQYHSQLTEKTSPVKN